MNQPAPTPAHAIYQQAGERVVFRCRPGWSVPFVELRGDLVHWQEGLEMSPTHDGWWEASCRVPVGTYTYKFLVGGSLWQLDAANPRTRGVEGVRNSLLVVGGTDEPLMHAPAAPYVHLRDDGAVCVRAGLRRGGADWVHLDWDEGHGSRSVAMDVVAEEDEHLLLEAIIPASARAVEYVFRLSDGRALGHAGGPGQAFRIQCASLRRSTPAWWKQAVLYSVFVDRFRRGGCGGYWGDEQLAIRDGSPAGGDLAGIVEALPHLVELGVTALHLTPIVLARSCHRYDAVDLSSVDPALGGESGLQLLLDEALAVGLRVLLDVSITHVHRDFAPFVDVCHKGEASAFWDWFYPRQHPFREGLVPGYLHYRKGAWQEPLLRLDNPEVADFLVATFEHWARSGADGFRIDAAADIPIELLRRIARSVRAARPEAALFGEVVTDNVHRWNAGVLDAATDFGVQETLYDWLWRKRRDARSAASSFSRRRFWRGGPGWSSLAFVGTHDQHRMRTLTADPRAARLALLQVLLRSEVPALYYGDEVGLCGTETGRNFEDTWPDRQCMPWDRSTWDLQTLTLVREALRLRASHPALQQGDDQFLSGEGDQDVLVLRRSHGEQVIDVLLNASACTHTLSLPPAAPSAARVLLSLGLATFDEASAAVTLAPWSAMVCERVPPAHTREVWRELVGSNSRACAEAWRAGQVEWLGLPSRLYLTVTEACNLRCRHCINHSPERTASGTARHLQLWVIERLGDALSAADYFGFTHGGESLLSPVFPTILRAIQRARLPGAPVCQVHLLTNGMLLLPDTSRQLIDLGVTSLGVSLDGARAETTERLRVASSLQTVLRNLRHCIRLRTTTSADLRVGVSMVVTASNLAELPEMGSLAVDLGLDWLKLEEVFPCTSTARQEYLPPRDPRVIEAVQAVRDAIAGSPVVLVDHLSPPTGCACDAAENQELRAFRAADDFANRAHFQPCRAAWEQACIDPDGTVHLVDYHHPSIGSLLEQSLLEVWHSETARALRHRALARTPAARRASCPIDVQVPAREARQVRS